MPARFDDAVARVRAALAARRPHPLDISGFRPSAVLVPLLRRPEGPTVLFTLRTNAVRHHKGEISFPGGGREPGEGTVAAALREAREEVGLDPAAVEVLGALDDVPSIYGYVVTPVVAAIAEPPARFAAQPGEVVEPFEIPLARLLEPGVRRHEWRDPAGLPREVASAILAVRAEFEEVDPATGRYRIWFFDAGEGKERIVWGLTGRILAHLFDRAFPEAAPQSPQPT